jgi:hypothetical protein
MKKLYLVLVFLGMIGFGFFQENMKVAINFQLDYLNRRPELQQLFGKEREEAIARMAPVSNIDYYYNHQRFDFLYELSSSQLSKLKWVHTLLFTLVYFSLNLLAARIWTGQSYLKPIGVFYSGLFSMALLIYLIGVLLGWEGSFYAVSRKIVGVLQSPLPVLITWLTRKLRSNLSIQE